MERETAAPVPGTGGAEGRKAALLALCATAAFSFAAHGFLFANEFFSHDSVSYFTYATGAPAFYTGIGRFLIPVYECVKGDVAAPWLIGLLFTGWMTLTALLTADLLRRRKLVICDTCHDCLREMGLYRWQEGAESPRKEHDHAMYDMRYFAATVAAEGGGGGFAALSVRRES